MISQFIDRKEAGRLLAVALRHYTGKSNSLVLGIPRGGVPVAFEVAHALHLPLDVYVVRKLGIPGHEELAMGAVAPGGLYVLDNELIQGAGIREHEFETVLKREERELARRERAYRQGRAPIAVSGKTVLLIDDGLATGSSMRAAIQVLRRQGVARLVVGVPVGPVETCEQLKPKVDEFICVRMPESGPFFAVGAWYEDFSPTTDEEVCDLLNRAHKGALESAA